MVTFIHERDRLSSICYDRAVAKVHEARATSL